MPNFCIPRQLHEVLKDAVKKGEISIDGLYGMTSQQRSELFQKYADPGTAQQINAGFEKALVSKQKGALKAWAESVFTTAAQKSKNYQGILKKIDELDQLGVLNPESAESFLSDLVAVKLGATVTSEEVQQISEKAMKLEEVYKEGVNEFGVPSIAYFKARREMENYLNSLVPASQVKIFTSTVGRGAMLFSIKSPVTNIVSNTVNGAIQAFERRLGSGKVGGSNNDYALEYVKYVNKVYKETGYDISRMTSLDSGRKTLGEDTVHSEGKGAIRKLGRFYEDVVFKNLMGAPDVAASSIAFADSANLASTKIAEREGLTGEEAQKKALEIFKDATSLAPETAYGELVRAQAIADAQYSTFTNESNYSSMALLIRKAINAVSGDLRMGDQLMPFVKTPANVIGAGIDAAGLSALQAAYKLPSAIRELKVGNKEPMSDVVRLFTRSGLGFTLAMILSAAFDPDDYIGEYPVSAKERELLALKNATPNSIKIGGKYVSLDYLGPLAAPFIGIMYARKYGTNLPDTVFRYGQGVVTQSLKIPGLRDFKDLVSNIEGAIPDRSKTLNQNLAAFGNSAIDYMRARIVPGIVYDLAKATDNVERDTTDEGPLAKLKNSIPGLRQTLPEKKNVLGESVKTEGAISTFLFGARVKTGAESETVKELVRLSSTGNLPSITDVEKTSPRVKELKAQIDDNKFDEAMQYYRTRFAADVEKIMATSAYKRMEDDRKKTIIDKVKGAALDRMLIKYGYKKPKK